MSYLFNFDHKRASAKLELATIFHFAKELRFSFHALRDLDVVPVGTLYWVL